MAQKVTQDTTSKLVNALVLQIDPSEILSKYGRFARLKK